MDSLCSMKPLKNNRFFQQTKKQIVYKYFLSSSFNTNYDSVIHATQNMTKHNQSSKTKINGKFCHYRSHKSHVSIISIVLTLHRKCKCSNLNKFNKILSIFYLNISIQKKLIYVLLLSNSQQLVQFQTVSVDQLHEPTLQVDNPFLIV